MFYNDKKNRYNDWNNQNLSGLQWLNSQYGSNGIASVNNGAKNAYNDQLKRANQTATQYLNNSFINLDNPAMAQNGSNGYAQSLAQSKTPEAAGGGYVMNKPDLRQNSILSPIFNNGLNAAVNKGTAMYPVLNYDKNNTWVQNRGTEITNYLNTMRNIKRADDQAERNRTYAMGLLQAQQNAYDKNLDRADDYQNQLYRNQVDNEKMALENAKLDETRRANDLRAEANKQNTQFRQDYMTQNMENNAAYRNEQAQNQRAKIADDTLIGIPGFGDLSEEDQAKAKTDYIKNGTLPKILKDNSGFFGANYTLDTNATEQQPPQQNNFNDDEMKQINEYARQNNLKPRINGDFIEFVNEKGEVVNRAKRG